MWIFFRHSDDFYKFIHLKIIFSVYLNNLVQKLCEFNEKCVTLRQKLAVKCVESPKKWAVKCVLYV